MLQRTYWQIRRLKLMYLSTFITIPIMFQTRTLQGNGRTHGRYKNL